MTDRTVLGQQSIDDDDDDPFALFNAAVGGNDPTSPYPVLTQLRHASPVHPGMPELGITEQQPGVAPTFSVYGYDPVAGVLRDHETFSSGAYHDLVGQVMGRSLLEMDEPEHRTYRLILQQAFSKAAMRRWEVDVVRPVVEETVDAFARAPERRAELVVQLCFPFPVRIIAAMLGLPEADYKTFQRLAVELIALTIDWDRSVAASLALRDYFAEVLADRRVEPRDDMISVLAHAEADGQRLSDDDVFAFLRLLLPAGAETTFRSSSSLLFGLLSDPSQLDAVRDDRSLLPAAVDEAVRWETPLQFVPRTANRDTEIGGVAIPAGANVNCQLGSANHDETRWDEPDRFDIHRERKPSVGFGYGVHTCLGMHLAKMETAMVVDVLLDRLPTLHLDPDQPEPFVAGNLLRSPPRLHVAW